MDASSSSARRELLLGLLVGQPRHGMVGGRQHVRQRRLGPHHRDRRPGVPGELRHVLGILRTVQAEQGLGHPGVQPHPPCPADLLVERLLNQAVGEAVPAYRFVVLDE